MSLYYGDEGNLEENLLAIAANEVIENAKIDGVIETAVTASSILIRYDPFLLEGKTLIRRLKEIMNRIRAAEEKIKIDSSIITIPVLYNDRWTRECAKAHNVRPNLEIVAEFNGLSSIEEVVKVHSGATYWVRYLGGPGLIGLIVLSEERVLAAPKYEVSRTWSPARSISLGGNSTCYYPFEMPGGMQLLGRLPVPLVDPRQTHPAFKEKPSICKVGDRMKIISISEEEYEEIERNCDKYEYRIQQDIFEYELKRD